MGIFCLKTADRVPGKTKTPLIPGTITRLQENEMII